MAAFALLLAAAAAPPGLCELHARGAWDELLRVGTVDSERFRRDLIKTGRGRAVCELAAEFFGSPAVRRRTAGDGFGAVTAADLFAGIGGTAGGDPAADFAPFAGRWFGRWDGNRVDHHWTATAPLDPPRVYELPGGPGSIIRSSIRLGRRRVRREPAGGPRRDAVPAGVRRACEGPGAAGRDGPAAARRRRPAGRAGSAGLPPAGSISSGPSGTPAPTATRSPGSSTAAGTRT